MDIEQQNSNEEHERVFNEFVTRQPIKDPSCFTLDLDTFRSAHSSTTQDVIKNPTKYYRLIRNFLEKNAHGD